MKQLGIDKPHIYKKAGFWCIEYKLYRAKCPTFYEIKVYAKMVNNLFKGIIEGVDR